MKWNNLVMFSQCLAVLKRRAITPVSCYKITLHVPFDIRPLLTSYYIKPLSKLLSRFCLLNDVVLVTRYDLAAGCLCGSINNENAIESQLESYTHG